MNALEGPTAPTNLPPGPTIGKEPLRKRIAVSSPTRNPQEMLGRAKAYGPRQRTKVTV